MKREIDQFKFIGVIILEMEMDGVKNRIFTIKGDEKEKRVIVSIVED